MNNLLKLSGLGIIAFMCVLSCTNDAYLASELKLLKDNAEVIANPYAISGEDAIAVANAISNRNIEIERNDGLLTERITSVNTVSMRSGSNRQASTSSKNYSVRIEEASSTRREVRQDIPVYTINYKDANGVDAGFVIIAGDTRISSKILIFSDDDIGKFDMAQRPDADFLEDMISGYLYYSVNFDKFNNTVTPTRNGVSVMLTDYICLGQLDSLYTRWNPFQISSTTKRCMTSPVATAMGEIMSWHQWPQHGTFKRYEDNGVLNNSFNASYLLSSTERTILRSNNMTTIATNSNVRNYIGNILAETGYRLNSAFGVYASLALASDAAAVFVEMGYSSVMVPGSYSYEEIKYDISNRILPVYMYGQGSTIGFQFYYEYAYVIYGYLIDIDNNNNTENFLFLVDGCMDIPGFSHPTGSWYNEKLFSTNSNPRPDPLPAGSENFPFKYNCKTITNLKPGTKTGSTDPTWVVRNTNPY